MAQGNNNDAGFKFFTPEEVAQHNVEHDCWTILHGTRVQRLLAHAQRLLVHANTKHTEVYDITTYLHKHPGGLSLILRAKGSDCTSDFEGMFHSAKARKLIENFYIGELKGGSSNTLSQFVRPAPSYPFANKKTTSAIPTTSTYTSTASFKVPTTPKSTTPKTEQAPPDPKKKVIAKVYSSTAVNHNTKLIKFYTDVHNKIQTPLPGQHFVVSLDLGVGEPISRQYTPISSLGNYFELLVKKYDAGPISAFLHSLNVNDQIFVSGPFGTYDYTPSAYKYVALIGCGTGITPLYQVLNRMLNDRSNTSQISLLFANHSEEDILLKKELDVFADKHKDRLQIHYLLSKPKGEWPLVGRVNEEIIRECVQKDAPDFAGSDTQVLLCGTDGFVEFTKGVVTTLMPKANMFVF